MAMGTTDRQNPNERMGPPPYTPVQQMQTPRPPGSDEHGRDPTRDKPYPAQYQQGEMIPPPGWAGTTNVDEPYLPRDFDKVLVMRCYPEAESFGELREIAYQHGREVLQMARESTRQQAEIAGQPDPHDLSQWVEPQPHMRPGQPNPGQPFLANPPPQPPPGQQPGQPQPGQPHPDQPQQPNQPNQPSREAQGREARERDEQHKREEEQRRHREEQQKKREEEQNKPK